MLVIEKASDLQALDRAIIVEAHESEDPLTGIALVLELRDETRVKLVIFSKQDITVAPMGVHITHRLAILTEEVH